MKIQYLFILIILGGSIYGQSLQQQKDYKAAVRIKLRLDDNPLLYMDEPTSAHLNTAHDESVGFIVFYENRQLKKLQTKMNRLDAAAKRYHQTKYNQTLPKRKQPHIRYNYFSVSSAGRD